MPHHFLGFRNRYDLIDQAASGRAIVHLGAIGLAYESFDRRVAGITSSLHAHLTSVAAECVGIDIASDVVAEIQRRDLCDNLVAGDATKLNRSDIPLASIDVVVAGDLIEHLSNPGGMLDGIHHWSDPSTSLIVTTPNAVGLPLFGRYALGKPVDGEDHLLSFNVYTLSRLLERHGWRIDEIWGCHQPSAERSKWFRFGCSILSRCPHLAGTLFVRASKLPLAT